jgi:predicted PurR-regulated permease PerM
MASIPTRAADAARVDRSSSSSSSSSEVAPKGRATQKAEVIMVVIAAALVGVITWPIWRPLLVAAVIAGVLGPAYGKVVKRLGGRRSLVAGLFTAATVLVILIPLTALAAVAVREATSAFNIVRSTLESGGLAGLIEKAPEPIERWLDRAQSQLPQKLENAREELTTGGRWTLGALSSTLGVVGRFGFQLAMMLIALFFLLRDGRALLDWLADATPLGGRVRTLAREFRTVARSVVAANVITGLGQAVVATVGFYIARAPSPIFFGLLTVFASLIPSVGTALITLPVAGLLLLLGHPWAALFLASWSLVIVGLIDNLLRPLLIRGGNLHGALVFFSLIGAIAAVGPVGLLLGPILLSFLLAAVRISRADGAIGASHPG